MAWEISHTDEAWVNVERNLETWTREQLSIALADDAFELAEENGSEFADCKTAADAMLALIADAPTDALVGMAIDTIRSHNTCSNGGFDFWVDRQGFHTVPVDFTPETGDWEVS